MKKLWFVLVIVMLLATACSPAVLPTAEVAPTKAAPTDTAVPTEVSPTATEIPPTPEPTATDVPPTATALPPTPTLTLAPVEIIADVPYVDDGNEHHTATIYLPEGFEGPYPTVVVYHSGAYFHGEEPEALIAYESVARYFAGFGYATVVPRHRTSATDPYPAIHQDAFCALAWMHAIAGEYGLDTTRVAALGLDSGADLAASIGTFDDPAPYLEGCAYPWPEEPVQAVVSIGGYYDLLECFTDGDAAQEMFQNYLTYYFQADPEQEADVYKQASPITHIDGSEPPFHVIYNNYFSNIPIWYHAGLFISALEAAGLSVQQTEIRSASFWLLMPFSSEMTMMSVGWEPTLADYGFPEAAVFLAEIFAAP